MSYMQEILNTHFDGEDVITEFLRCDEKNHYVYYGLGVISSNNTLVFTCQL